MQLLTVRPSITVRVHGGKGHQGGCREKQSHVALRRKAGPESLGAVFFHKQRKAGTQVVLSRAPPRGIAPTAEGETEEAPSRHAQQEHCLKAPSRLACHLENCMMEWIEELLFDVAGLAMAGCLLVFMFPLLFLFLGALLALEVLWFVVRRKPPFRARGPIRARNSSEMPAPFLHFLALRREGLADQETIRAWFGGAPIESIRRENLKDLLSWAFFQRIRGSSSDPCADLEPQLEEMSGLLCKVFGLKPANGRSPGRGPRPREVHPCTSHPLPRSQARDDDARVEPAGHLAPPHVLLPLHRDHNPGNPHLSPCPRISVRPQQGSFRGSSTSRVCTHRQS